MKAKDINEKVKVEAPELYVLVGLPGSGKSTWTNNFLASTNKAFVVLSTDNILERIAEDVGISYNEAYESDFARAEKEMKARAKVALANRENIIWDQTNLGANKRRKILASVPRLYRKIAVVFELPYDELVKRLNKREQETGKRVPLWVIDSMAKAYIEPSKAEGFDEIQKVKV